MITWNTIAEVIDLYARGEIEDREDADGINGDTFENLAFDSRVRSFHYRLALPWKSSSVPYASTIRRFPSKDRIVSLYQGGNWEALFSIDQALRGGPVQIGVRYNYLRSDADRRVDASLILHQGDVVASVPLGPHYAFPDMKAKATDAEDRRRIGEEGVVMPRLIPHLVGFFSSSEIEIAYDATDYEPMPYVIAGVYRTPHPRFGQDGYSRSDLFAVEPGSRFDFDGNLLSGETYPIAWNRSSKDMFPTFDPSRSFEHQWRALR